MLWTHKIAWRNLCSLFLNIVKKGKGLETSNCPNNSFPIMFVADCLKKSEKLSAVFYSFLFYIKMNA